MLAPIQNDFWNLAKSGDIHVMENYKLRLETIDGETSYRIDELLPGGKPGPEPVPHLAAFYSHLAPEKQAEVARLVEAMDKTVTAATNDKTVSTMPRAKQTARAREHSGKRALHDEVPAPYFGRHVSSLDQGRPCKPSQRTDQPASGNPGACRAGAPSHPAAIMATALRRPPLPGR